LHRHSRALVKRANPESGGHRRDSGFALARAPE
jgi:hypothetical protein